MTLKQKAAQTIKFLYPMEHRKGQLVVKPKKPSQPTIPQQSGNHQTNTLHRIKQK